MRVTKKIFSISSIVLVSFFALCLTVFAQTAFETETEATSTVTNEESAETQQQRQTENVETRQEVRAAAVETRQETRSENVENRQEIRAENIETRQELRAERAGALTEIRQNRVLNLSANISNRMEAAIARLFTISERLESRIEKLTASGVDTDAARVKLDEAKDFLTKARSSLADIDTLVYNAATSPEPRVGWQNVRAVYAEAARLIRGAHLALRETIGLLKTAVATRDGNPSAAVENTNNEAETAE